MAREDDVGPPLPPEEGPPAETRRAAAPAAAEETLDGKSAEAQQLLDAAGQDLALGQTFASTGLVAAEARPTLKLPVENWDRYEILNLLGQGGMGAVYKGRDRKLGRIVALKFIRGADVQMTARFMQEARAQSRVDHPGICKVFEVGEVKDKAFIAMQFVDGLPLQHTAKQMSLVEKVQVVRDTAEALHAAHALGIIHRDIKPSNIMIERRTPSDSTEGGSRFRPVVMDFGLAREANEGKGLTESGAVMGTPAYMSPEQARGDVRRLDQRTDVYSLGATLYEILSGNPPFEDESVVNVLLRVLNDDVPPLREKLPEIPIALDTIVSKCLNKEMAQRYPTAEELADDLSRFLNNERIVGKKVGLWYRLQYRARHNKPVAALLVALFFSLVGLMGYGVFSRIQAARKEREAQLQSSLSKELGQSVESLEWLMRIAYSLPLHDAGKEKALVRQRMDDIKKKLDAYGALGAPLGHFALGQGYLALHDWDKAHSELKQAEALGVKEPKLWYGLGRVLGELYNTALDEARKSGDKSFVETRKKELERQYLVPARTYLHNSRHLETVSGSYIEALIDFYNERYDATLINAHMSQQQLPWLYEAKKLEGDVFAARALAQKDRGDYDQAELNYEEAVRRYGQAAEIGRSDYLIYEAIAEVWVRREEIDIVRGSGQDPASKLRQALAAADKSIEAAPSESSGWIKAAYAYMFQACYYEFKAQNDALRKTLRLQIKAGRSAVEVSPGDPFAHDVLGIGYKMLSQSATDNIDEINEGIAKAKYHFNIAIKINKRFTWAYNDMGILYYSIGIIKFIKNEDPTPDLTSAIEYGRQASEIDDNYETAYLNTASAYATLALWHTEHGRAPMAAIAKGVDAAKRVIKLNNQDLFAYIVIMQMLYSNIKYYELSREDPAPLVESMETYVKKCIEISKESADCYKILARAHFYNAKYIFENTQASPLHSIQKGQAALDNCHKFDPGNANCAAISALLHAQEAVWLGRTKAKPLSSMAMAMAMAGKAARQAPKDRDVLWAAAEVSQKMARLRLSSGLSAQSEIAMGMSFIDEALRLAPDWPQALAVMGALRAVQASTQKDPALRRQSASQAEAALVRAFAGNALLRNSYGNLLLEVREGTRASPSTAIRRIPE